MKTGCKKNPQIISCEEKFTFSQEDGKRRPLRRAIGKKYRQVSFRDVRRSNPGTFCDDPCIAVKIIETKGYLSVITRELIYMSPIES